MMNMKRKIFSGALMVAALLLMLFPSCVDLDGDKVEYTAEKEQQFLKEYIDGLVSKGVNVDTTALGVFYVRQKEGTGPFPAAGDTISIKYVGYLMDGTSFDTSFRNNGDSLWTYVIEPGKNIKGWEEMMPLMNKGCKMEFVIPSSLAYGSQWAGYIPPYSSLIFVAVMDNVRKKAQ